MGPLVLRRLRCAVTADGHVWRAAHTWHLVLASCERCRTMVAQPSRLSPHGCSSLLPLGDPEAGALAVAAVAAALAGDLGERGRVVADGLSAGPDAFVEALLGHFNALHTQTNP